MKKFALLAVTITAVCPLFTFGGSAARQVSLPVAEDSVEAEDVDIADIMEQFQALIDAVHHQPDYDYAQSVYENNGEEYPLATAEEKRVNEQYDMLLKDVQAVLTKVPDAPDALFWGSLAGLLGGNTGVGVDYAVRLYSFYPTSDEINQLLEFAFYKDDAGTLRKLEKAVDKLLAEEYYDDYEIGRIGWTMSMLAKQNGYLMDGLRYAKMLTSLEDKTTLHKCNALIYIAMDKCDDAIAELEAVAEDDRDENWNIYYSTAIRGAKGAEAALPFYEKMIKETPDDYMLKMYYLTALTLAGHYDEAIALADTMETDCKGSDVELYLRRGVARKLNGDDKGARIDFNKAVEFADDDNTSIKIIALCYLGRRDEAIEILNESFDLTTPDVMSFAATVYNMAGDKQKALDYMMKSYVRCTWSPGRTKCDIHQRDLMELPAFEGIARTFNPALRKL